MTDQPIDKLYNPLHISADMIDTWWPIITDAIDKAGVDVVWRGKVIADEPSRAAMEAAVELEIEGCIGAITTRGLALKLDKIVAGVPVPPSGMQADKEVLLVLADGLTDMFVNGRGRSDQELRILNQTSAQLRIIAALPAAPGKNQVRDFVDFTRRITFPAAAPAEPISVPASDDAATLAGSTERASISGNAPCAGTETPQPDAVRTALADEIEKSDGLVVMQGQMIYQLGIKKTAIVIAALRSPAPAVGVAGTAQYRTALQKIKDTPMPLGSPARDRYVHKLWKIASDALSTSDAGAGAPVAYRVLRGGQDGKYTGLYSTRNEAELWLAAWRRDFDHNPVMQSLYVALPPVRDRETMVPPVKCIEMVDWTQGYKQPADPMWRVEVSGYCADFYTETAANNFRNAILSLPLQPSAGSLAPDDECLVPKSDRNDLDDVCRELGIQDSHVTPAEAVRELYAEIERLSSVTSPVPDATVSGEPTFEILESALTGIAATCASFGKQPLETIIDFIKRVASPQDAGRAAAIEDFAKALELRANGFEARGTSIFSGHIVADELNEQARRIRSLATKGGER